MDNFRKNPEMAPNVISRIHQLSEEFLKEELEKAGIQGLVASHGHILGCLYMEDNLPMWRIAALIKRRKKHVDRAGGQVGAGRVYPTIAVSRRQPGAISGADA